MEAELWRCHGFAVTKLRKCWVRLSGCVGAPDGVGRKVIALESGGLQIGFGPGAVGGIGKFQRRGRPMKTMLQQFQNGDLRSQER
jgi:hypothetical protein